VLPAPCGRWGSACACGSRRSSGGACITITEVMIRMWPLQHEGAGS
jgi:hypothetical protein